MPAVAFPAVACPTRRTLTPGVYPVRRFTALSGASTAVIFGDRASDAKLSLSFTYVPDADAALVWQAWHDSLGGFHEVTLPSNAFEGIGAPLVAQLPAYLKWYMEGEPEAESVLPGRSSMTVNFVGKLVA
jgi:hypothetical protein